MSNEAQKLKRHRVEVLDEILGVPFKVLDDGFVRLIDYLGSDESIVQAARVSYGAGTKKVSEDRGLIRYLMRHRHTTPFEMCEIKLHVRVPMDCWRQWIRHRTACLAEGTEVYFDLPGGIGSGTHTVQIAAGVLETAGGEPVREYAGQFVVPTPPEVTTLPPSDPGANLATLHGEFTATGQEDAEVRFYWGTTDGGADPQAWQHVVDLGTISIGGFSSHVGNFELDTAYFYRAYASNLAGGAWAPESQSFTTLDAFPPTLVGHWTFDDADVAGDVIADVAGFPGGPYDGVKTNDGPSTGAAGIVGQAALFGGGANNLDNQFVDLAPHAATFGTLSE